MDELIERLKDEAGGYGDGPTVFTNDDIAALRSLLNEAAAALEAAREDAESLREVLHDEIEANLKFREAGGASPDEDMPTFCARLLAERAEYRDRSLRLAVKYVVQKGRTAAAIDQARGKESGNG